MTFKKALCWICSGLLCLLVVIPGSAQGNRGKAELKAGTGNITIDYGRPSLKGRDMISQLQEGSFWRMGMNQATVFTTPVNLTIGDTTVAKGSYSIWLKRAGDKYLLVFNSQTGQWGTQHDPSKDVVGVPLKQETLSSPVETFTIDLKEASHGGTFSLSWGTTKLSTDFVTGS
ncbi:MAG TPA: DUF2911 domain-containing protein [Acidobacteriota bacterium]|nr:DUF2911 domain-containing protein [Acidobacteriota bacterium]